MSPLPASPALNSLLRLLREGAPLVERVGALRRLLLEHPGTRQAWYLAGSRRRRPIPRCRRRRRCRRAPASRTGPATWRCASGWCATAGWLWTNCGVPRPGSARACGVPAWSMAWPSPSTCRPATKACCWWPAIRRRALRWTGSACSSHRCSPPPVASPALRRSSRPTRSRRCCSTARRRRWNSTRPSLPCLASGRARPGALTSRPTMGNWCAPAWGRRGPSARWRRSATDASCSGSSFPTAPRPGCWRAAATQPPACAASARRRGPAGCTG